MQFRASGVVSKWMRSGDDGAQPAGVEFSAPVPGPPLGQVGPRAVDGLGDVAQVLLGVVDVNDLDGPGKLLGGDVPNPRSAVTDDDLTVCGVETAPYCLAMDTLGEGGRLRSVSGLAALSTAPL